MFGIFTIFLAAKMSKENPAETCTNEHKILKAELQPAQDAVEDGKQMVIVKTPQSTSSVEDCKIQTLKEGNLLDGPLETPEKMKKEDEKMENVPCKEDSDSSSEKGKCHL